MVREIPLSVLFSFPKPNYVDPVTRGPALIIINAIFISLCTIVLFLRLYTRIFIKRWFGSDDVFIILAYISTVALTANVIIANVHFYWNRHVWDIPISSFSGVLKVAFSAKLIFVFAATFTRQSLLCFYYRLIADSGMKWFDWALHVTVFFNVAAAIAFTCLGIWLCVPISAYWTISPPDGAHCLDEGRVVLGIGIVNCVIDLLITALPIPIITRLQMPMQQRIGVMILLSLGFVVVVAGAVRTYYIWKGLIVSYDETWLTFPLWIAAAVEINLGVICACMPALRPFISRYITPAFSNVTSRISSFISRSSTRQSTASTTRTSGNRYRKFSSGNNNHNDGSSSSSAPRTIGSSAASTTLKSSTNLGSRPSPYATTTTASDPDEVFFVTTPIELADRHRHHRSARSSFGSEHGRTALPRTQLPAVQSHSPLEITCRHSFEIVSLDRGRGGGGGGGGDGEEDGPLELDPREREWRAEVSCPREDQERGLVEGEKKGDGGVEGEGAGRERMGRKRSFVMGKGWGRF